LFSSPPKPLKDMSWWLASQEYSRQTQLIGAAIIGGLTAATTIYSIQALSRNAALEKLKASIPPLTTKHQSQKVRTT
jgi:tRNA threonylcarbamoyladenosine dehydratase